MVPVQKALAQAGMKPNEINDVVLVGGTSRIPYITTLLRGWFGDGVHMNSQVDPDEVVATGATVMAGILTGRLAQQLILSDVTPLPLGIV